MKTNSPTHSDPHHQAAPNPPTANAAFSLTEILIALGIIAFCLTTIFGLFAAPIKISFTNQNETAATLAAHQISSLVRAFGPTEIPSGTYFFDDKLHLTKSPAPDTLYMARLSYSTEATTAQTPFTKITIEVTPYPPPAAGSAAPRYTFVTYIPSLNKPTPPSL
ncbi:MAG: hypothetical protein NZM04_01555 [Methylacidiphilales bacterium]|nr:hypothetical protein [Candidatus Methylacidiphilales bacterium]MDW8349152.1 hypothetical protein [Verrucomicrobiae bacterium]